MVEVVHEVQREDATNLSYGLILGIVLIAAVALLLFYFFGRGMSMGSANPTIQVPDKINVDVNQPAQSR